MSACFAEEVGKLGDSENVPSGTGFSWSVKKAQVCMMAGNGFCSQELFTESELFSFGIFAPGVFSAPSLGEQ